VRKAFRTAYEGVLAIGSLRLHGSWALFVVAPLLLLPNNPGDREPTMVTMSGHRCGVERAAVKNLTDPDAPLVNLLPIPATVESLAALPIPAGWSKDSPRLPDERQTYTVRAELVGAKREGDSDYHLVLRGTTGATMIAEIPDPRCAAGSRFVAQLASVRMAFDARWGAAQSTGWTRIGQMVEVTGPLFLDEVHGQSGVAPNGAEIHPVLSIR